MVKNQVCDMAMGQDLLRPLNIPTATTWHIEYARAIFIRIGRINGIAGHVVGNLASVNPDIHLITHEWLPALGVFFQ
jgi:hypothetical protein